MKLRQAKKIRLKSRFGSGTYSKRQVNSAHRRWTRYRTRGGWVQIQWKMKFTAVERAAVCDQLRDQILSLYGVPKESIGFTVYDVHPQGEEIRKPVATVDPADCAPAASVPDDTYTCAMCEGKFTKDRPDEEALAECREKFGDVDREDLAIICDDCYRKMFGEEDVKQKGGGDVQ